MNFNPYPEVPHAKTQRRKERADASSFPSRLRAFVSSCENKSRAIAASNGHLLAAFLLFFAPLRLCVRNITATSLLALVLLSGSAQAEEASATAALSSETAAVGEAVELQITIQGAQKVAAPQVRVEGLEVRYAGESTQFQMNNFDVTRSVKFTYTVLPKKEGTFTIPALQLDAGGKKLATQPLKLTVSAQAGSAQGGTIAEKAESAFASAEWVVPKATAYVGEAIPAELRLYVDQRVQCQLQQMPIVSGDGFIVQKMGQPQQRQITKDGRTFTLAIFKTALTPVKTGKLTLPNADINTVAILPSKRQRRPQIPGFPDAFNDPFFSGAFNTQQQVTIRPDAVEMEIKPLPSAGKPQNFSGAVGQFTLETKAAPLRIHTGDPITVTTVVKGVGSFDRMDAPTFAEESGWHTYPASGKFRADDEVGISGAKTFEAAIIPETVHAALPKIEFSYFNPSTEKYETLSGDRIQLTMEGVEAPSPTPAAVVAAVPTVTPAATPQPKASDIQYIQIEPGARVAGFESVWRTRSFWLIQLLPLAALLALGGWQRRRLMLGDGVIRRAAILRQAKAEAHRLLRQDKTATGEFYDAAIRAIQLETALGQLRSEREPETIDADAACASRTLDCETAEGIRRLFAMHDEQRYAGVGSGGLATEPIYPDQRARVLQILEQFEKSHA